jgi:Ca-activated chloride channel homolog
VKKEVVLKIKLNYLKMNINFLGFIIILIYSNINAQNIDSKFHFYQGNKDYKNGEFQEALEKYNKANSLDTSNSMSLFNAGNASYRKNDFEEATMYYESYISKCGNKKEKSDGYYNIGNSNLKIWERESNLLDLIDKELIISKIEDNQDIKEKMKNFLITDSLLKKQKISLENKDKVLSIAIKSYKNAIRENPSINDARYNLSYAIRLLPEKTDEYNNEYKNKEKNKENEKQKTISENGKEIKKKTLKLIQENKFKEAYSLLNNGISKDETLKELEELNKKLKILNEILK